MFKPHVTVACIVHAEDKFLVVEETINGKSLWNQPAGHWRQMKRWRRPPRVNCGKRLASRRNHSILSVCISGLRRIRPRSCAFYSLSSDHICATEPHDNDIDCCRWVSADEILNAPNLRSPLVAESIRSYQTGQCYPLSIVGEFNWPFTEGVK